MSRMKPFFPYFGSKYRLAKHYPAPSGAVVVEPFAGSACYSTYHNAEEVVLIDADARVAEVWSYLLSATSSDILDLPDVANEGDEVYDHDIPLGAKHLIGFWLTKGATPVARRGAYAASDKWRHLFWRPDIKRRIASQLTMIQGWTSSCGDFEDAPRRDDALYFIDPPYQQAGKFYKVRFDEYERLGDWAMNLPGRVIVCEGADADWMPFRPMGDFKTFATGSSPEVVWMNEEAA